jgi:predicted transcriptional regulator of viral defense system
MSAIPQGRWEQFVRILRDAVSEPTERHPTVRLWTASGLTSLISEIRDKHREALRTTFPRAQQVIRKLIEIGWLHAIPVVPSKERPTFYLMDMEATGQEWIDPLELLQAARPHGVVSYLGALSVYELTTQIPAFFHIGRLIEGRPPETDSSATAPFERNPLGTELFRVGDIPCFESKRFHALTPGVQLRTIGPRTTYRITTLEQTLLDTLLQPQRCGGEAVVFEAWEQARNRCDWERMALHLASIARDTLTRRVGAILDQFEIRATATALANYLAEVQGRISPATPGIPVLPGLAYPSHDSTWRVYVP